MTDSSKLFKSAVKSYLKLAHQATADKNFQERFPNVFGCIATSKRTLRVSIKPTRNREEKKKKKIYQQIKVHLRGHEV